LGEVEKLEHWLLSSEIDLVPSTEDNLNEITYNKSNSTIKSDSEKVSNEDDMDE
jgi:hypothetical protein